MDSFLFINILLKEEKKINKKIVKNPLKILKYSINKKMEEPQIKRKQKSFSLKILNTIQTFSPAIMTSTLLIIFIISFCVRIFSVIKYESIIHEFDPWFNYRATQYLSEKGREEFAYWFDADSWYPLGRFVGHTVFPGLMYTTVLINKLLLLLAIPVDLRHICVFTAPFFSMITSLVAYLITIEINGKKESGLIAALFISVIPAYISRSVAGSYDNEAISITLLILTFYLFLKSVRTGNFLFASACALSYSYLVASWGGYSFVITFIPVFVLATLITKKYNSKIYLSYSIFYIIGCFWSMQTKFVEYKVFFKSEHLGSHFIFILLQGKLIYEYLSKTLKNDHFRYLAKFTGILAAITSISGVVYMGFMGKTKFSERVMTLLDPSYAKNFIPIIASVSEHQPTSWATFFFDLHFTLFFTPLGLYYILKKTTAPKLFIALYFVASVYFASLMVRLILILAPSVCIISAIGVSEFIHDLLNNVLSEKQIEVETKIEIEKVEDEDEKENESKELLSNSESEETEEVEYKIIKEKKTIFELEYIKLGFVILIVVFIGFLMLRYMLHGSIVGAEVYSSPSVILSNRNFKTGEKNIVDDFREAYYWLRKNSVERSKVLSWWDYGYQIAGFSNRTTIVDNNTWNFTHIAYTGKVFASNEDEAYEILKDLEVDYVMVLFGGRTGFAGDDMNKFLWIIRIAGNSFPHIKEQDFMTPQGFSIDSKITKAMRESVMYKLNYYRFWEEYTGRGKGYDLVRNAKIGHINYKLKYFEEVFTSYRWLVRIYKVKKKNNREDIKFTPNNVLDTPRRDKRALEDNDYFFV